MPLYCFACDQCGEEFEILASIKQKEAGLEPECPKCQSRATTQMITAGLTLRGSSLGYLSRTTCGPNPGPGCCRS
jgi:putative FmdB family regulatory protein